MLPNMITMNEPDVDAPVRIGFPLIFYSGYGGTCLPGISCSYFSYAALTADFIFMLLLREP